MLAARLHSLGDPSGIVVEEVPDPREPVGDELLVQVAASSINGTDLLLRRGEPRIATAGRLPLVLGFDVAGEVLRCGPAVTAFAPGDRVVSLLGHGGGAHAERVLLRQGRAARAPAWVSLEVAGALPLAGLTALQALHGRAALDARPGARVLVVGASGGIGAFAVLLAKLAGAHVTALTSTAAVPFVTGLGADEVLDRHREDPFAGGERWDVVVDTPAVLRFGAVRGSLRDGGVLVSTKPLSLDAARSAGLDLLRRPGRRIARRGGGSGARFATVRTQARSQDLTRLVALVDGGRLRVPVDRAFPLAQVAEAHRWAQTRATGKVVLTLPSDQDGQDGQGAETAQGGQDAQQARG
ncbi:NAD(P)-dependent alcohol dehydrogenase [Quadrisphaera sp. DSM 44207]|uniref:NAD(P)-dependent alcohol dehydrogenase n=1 Tax=Quadrisphaera sp. DSM 44207 TaxID=1881057 RepID=UPI00088E959F|nr:NAD(P)-dependent alcohol dehydrogenase [Quadrisphaera sp. DSM 44207]SDQ05195.1 NADPH:quinone reductase [Quadrisphaera sp. DSM 44207]